MFRAETAAGTQEKAEIPGRHMADSLDGRNGRPSPKERAEELAREDARLKREVDEALREWDSALERDEATAAAERA
jgi:hypothetical protein